jgi:hypothetical protein
VIHARNVVHETLDGETIVIHLDNGSYYSLTGSGSEIWNLLGAGATVPQICAQLALRHRRQQGDIRSEVDAFISELRREELVDDGEAGASQAPAGPTEADGAWVTPKLERYDDMRDFLLVDPIHEVDETGWPSRRTAP